MWNSCRDYKSPSWEETRRFEQICVTAKDKKGQEFKLNGSSSDSPVKVSEPKPLGLF